MMPNSKLHPVASLGLLASVLLFSFLPLAGCGGEGEGEGEPEAPPQDPLLRPGNFTETAPESYEVLLRTTKGEVRLAVTRSWAPLAADRFYNLVKAGYYDDVTFHRVMPGFVAEFGIHGDEYVNYVWRRTLMADEPVRQSNTRGRLSFSKSGPNSRSVQVFINTDDNSNLDEQGFSPFGEVVGGMDVVDALYSGYGDGPPRGEGVYQAMALARGDAYLREEFPLLDRIERAIVVEPEVEG